jgi:hypothetical protein
VTRVEHVTGNYISLANYQADKNGIVDTTRESSVGGSFKGTLGEKNIHAHRFLCAKKIPF